MIVTLIFVLVVVGSNLGVDGFLCPMDGLFPNSNDKHSFFQCSFGISFLMQCPSKLIWNAEKQICDWDTDKPVINCNEDKFVNCRQQSKWSPNGIPVVGLDNKYGTDSQHLASPFGLFIDSEHGNNVYVADTDNHRIQKFLHGSLAIGGVTVAGGNGKGNASNQLNMPRAIYVDQHENIYIADDDNNRIQFWLKGATSGITVAGGHGKGKALNQIGACHGLFVHEQSNTLFISDFYNDRIVKWIPEKDEGIIVAGTGVGGSNASQLLMPRGIFVDECQTIYVADMWNNRVQRWKKDAKEGITVAGGHGKGSADDQLNQPWDVKLDQYKNVYIADTDNYRIVVWRPSALSGETVAGGNGWGDKPNQFKSAYAVALDKEGNIFVSEQRNYRIQVFHIKSETNSC